MSKSEMDSRFLARVSRLQQDELSYRSRLGWSLVASFVGGVVVGPGAWIFLKPTDRDNTAFAGVMGLGVVAGLALVWLLRNLGERLADATRPLP